MLFFLILFSVYNFVSGWQRTENIFPSLPIAVSRTENVICKQHSELYVNNLENFTLWAHEMWDATAKSTVGVLRGSIFQMGHFEQCLTAKAPFPTQYCLATITAQVPKPDVERDHLSLFYHPQSSVLERLYKYSDVSQQSRNVIKAGWCIPASCTTVDLQLSLTDYLNDVEHPLKSENVSYTSEFSPIFCSSLKDKHNYTAADIIFCLFSGVLIFLLIVVTYYDFHTPASNKDEKPQKRYHQNVYLMAFSAKQNWNSLNKMDESNPALAILYGMRTISILMIIIGHRFGTYLSSALLNFDFIEKQYRNVMTSIIFHCDLFVDSFFILSGLLVTYSMLCQLDKKVLNPAYIIFLRYVRLTPVYAFVIFYYATLFNYTGDGPMWKVIAGGDSQDCKDNWWTNLLYISNYVNADHMCMTHSWYLPCDFHYFIIGICVCFLIKKEKKLGLGSLVLLTVLSVAIPFILTIVYQRPALLYFYPEFLTGPKIHPDFLLTYCKSHTRATPYFIGMFAGYIYYKLKGTELHINRIKSVGLTIVSICLMLLSVFGGAIFYNPYHQYNSIESASYAALNRAAWSVGSVGFLFLASYGHGSLLNMILCWSPWIPLSKLVYGAYLVHMQFQLRSAAKFMNPRHISYFDVFSLGLSDIFLAFLTALLLYLAVEAPARIIFRNLLTPTRETRKVAVEPTMVSESMVQNNNSVNQDSRL